MSLTPVPYLKSYLFHFPSFSGGSTHRSTHLHDFARRSDIRSRNFVRVDPLRDRRLSRERLSNGLSLWFVYGWVHKSVSCKRSRRCLDRHVGIRDDDLRIIARSSRADKDNYAHQDTQIPHFPRNIDSVLLSFHGHGRIYYNGVSIVKWLLVIDD